MALLRLGDSERLLTARRGPGAAVNPEHPLAQGLIAWWRALPWQFGSHVWYDLVSGIVGTLRDGMLVGSATRGWGLFPRPGGVGGISFDVNDGVVTTVPLLVPDMPFSVACMYQVPTPGTSIRLAWSQNTTGAAATRISLLHNGSGGAEWRYANHFHALDNVEAWAQPLDALAHHCLLAEPNVDDARAAELYIDGTPLAHTGTATGITLGAANFIIGGRANAGNGWLGMLDDVMVWDRGLSATEAALLYRSVRAGHATLLRRRSRWVPVSVAVPGGTTLTCSPARAQWQAAAPLLSRTVVCRPAQAQWQVATLVVTPGRLTAGAVRAQWQAPAPSLMYTVTTLPARAQWQAPAPLLTRTLVCRPAQPQWQAPAASVTQAGETVILVNPAQAAWRAPSALLTRTIRVTPAQAQWQAPAPVIRRGIVCNPAQAPWQAPAPVIRTGQLIASPARAQWQAPAVLLGRTLTCSPAQAQWQTPTASVTQTTTGVIVVSPARATWQVPAPALTRAIICQPASAQWQAPAPVLTRTLTCSPAQALWHVPDPLIARTVVASPVSAQWQAPVTIMARTIVVTPTRAQWQASTPLLMQTLVAVPAEAQWQAVIPLTARTLLVLPGQAQWQAPGAGITGGGQLLVQGAPARAAWQAAAGSVLVGLPPHTRLAPAVVVGIETQAPAVVLTL